MLTRLNSIFVEKIPEDLRYIYHMKTFERICLETCLIAKEAGEFIRNEAFTFSSKDVEYKSAHDLVSFVDKRAESLLVEKLGLLIPGCGFITEEDNSRLVAEEFNWIIDPLDGTTNFVHGLPCYCVSIALFQNNVPVIGVVYEINANECFYSWSKAPAYLNGSVIRCSAPVSLNQSLLATGFPTIDYSHLEEFMEVFKFCLKNTRGLRRLGSAAADLAYVACGRLDGFFEYALNPWDVSAGAFIVEQAGGKISDFSGGKNYIYGKEIIASSSTIFPEFLSMIKKAFRK